VHDNVAELEAPKERGLIDLEFNCTVGLFRELFFYEWLEKNRPHNVVVCDNDGADYDDEGIE